MNMPKFLIEFIGRHWLTKPYSFQVCNSTKHCLHTASCSHCPQQNLSIPIFPILTISTTPNTFFSLVITTLLSVSMCFFLKPFTFFHQPSHPPSSLTTVSWFHVSMPLLLFCSSVYFVHQIPHISEIIRYLSFTDWLISLSIIISSSIHALMKGAPKKELLPFLCLCSISLCKCTTVF